MKLPGGFFVALGTALIAHLMRAQAIGGGGGGGARPAAARDAFSRFAGVSEVGVAEVHPIAPEDEQVGADLVEELEADAQTTVVGQVELGELLCDSLEDAPDSTLLRFAITSDETVIAERTSYSSIEGGVLADGKERKVWMGNVVDPEPLFPRTVSMTWTDPCNVESFLLKIVSANADGSTAIIKSIPCSAGSSTELCMVELAVVFYDEQEEPEEDDPVEQRAVRKLTERSPTATTAKESLNAPGIRGRDGDAATTPSGRGLADTTTIDVMVLYTPEAWAHQAITEEQLQTNIAAAFQSSDAALANSGIDDLEFNLVHVGLLPYDQMAYDRTKQADTGPELYKLGTDGDVLALRNLHRADLVMLVGSFPRTCGLGNFFNGDQKYAFSLTDSGCFDNFSHTHEMVHNLGCLHNRENSTTVDDYRHGWRWCDGDLPYRTIMAYSTRATYAEPCQVSRVNYFSSPDVTYKNRPTGNAQNDNVRCIRSSMEAVSHFRDPCVDGGRACDSRDDCCSDSCLEGVCAPTIAPSPAPVITATPSPTEGSTCESGIPGIQASNVCCPTSCGSCGGPGCSGRDGGNGFGGFEACCGGGVRSLDRVCSDDVGAPCIYPEDPTPAPVNPQGPTCEGGIPGIQASNVCCPASCGACGGSGCSGRDGGNDFNGFEACCGGGVRSLGRVCSDGVGAPCTYPEEGPACQSGIPGIQASNVCCPTSCGSCGGSGCSGRDGGNGFSGSEACCGGGVRLLDRVCSDDVGAPCIYPEE